MHPPGADQDLVRCVACACVYALSARGAPGAAACPTCGAVSWIAVVLPRPRAAGPAARKFRA